MIATSVGGEGDVFPVVTSLPAGPSKGEAVTLSLTGRDVVMIYDGTDWVPVHSLGSMTMYVDGGSGTDSPTKGTGTGSDAFATIQYAINQIPSDIGGNVTINIAAGTYTEDVDIKGKEYSGPYSITLNGTLTQLEAITSATVSAGTGATQGTVTKAGAFTGDSYANKLCYFVTDDEYRLIDSHTNDTLTLVGTAPSSTTQNIVVYDWGTIIDGSSTRDYCLSLGSGQKSVYMYDLQFKDSINTNLSIDSHVSTYLYRCFSEVGSSGSASNDLFGNGIYILVDTYFSQGLAGDVHIQQSTGSTNSGIISKSKFLTGSQGLILGTQAYFQVRAGTIIDGMTSNGINANQQGMVSMYSTAAEGYNRVRNCGIGLKVKNGGQIVNTANNQYSGNTTDEDAEAASYGYID